MEVAGVEYPSEDLDVIWRWYPWWYASEDLDFIWRWYPRWTLLQ